MDAGHGRKVRAGIARARAQGARVGRPRNARLTPDAIARARAMRAKGMILREIALALGVPKSTLHRALQS